MLEEIVEILKELLPEYKIWYNHLHGYTQIADKFGWTFCVIDDGTHHTHDCHDYNCTYDLADPNFSFEDLACDLILAEEFASMSTGAGADITFMLLK